MKTAAQMLVDNIADPTLVDQALLRNQPIVMDIFQTLYGTVADALGRNAQANDRIDRRIHASVNGHIRRNNQLLGPVIDQLVNHVNHQLAENQAQVNMITARPEVQDWMRRVPPTENWKRIVPPPPAPGELTADGQGSATGEAPAPTVGGTTTYTLWYHCRAGQATAIPNQSDSDADLMLGQGWRPFPDGQTLQANNVKQVHEYLSSIRPRIQQLCAAG